MTRLARLLPVDTRTPTTLTVLALAIAAPNIAQRVVLDADARGFGPTSRTTLVRAVDPANAANDALFSLSIKPNGALLLLTSADGKAWKDTGFTINDANSGIGNGVLTNYCCMAVDSRGWLHVSWRRATYPSFYSQYYRNLNPFNTSQASNIIDVQTTIAKQSTTIRGTPMGVALDSKGHVWMLATGSQHVSRLFRSDLPFATGATPGFTSVGDVSPSGTASQNPFLIVDSNDVVHCMFHYANRTRSVAHNAYDPSTKQWTGVVRLGTPANNNGLAAADRRGNVHALYGIGAGPYSLEYRKWDATNGWSNPLRVTSFTAAQLGSSNSKWTFTIAAHPISGQAVILFRDFANGGALVLQKKALTDTAFSHVATVEPASTGKNQYDMVNVRGSLHPFPINAAMCHVDLAYQDRSGTKILQVFQRLNLCSTATFGSACKGTNGTPRLSYSELPRLGRPFAIDLSSARANTGAVFILGISNTTWLTIPLPLDLTPLGAPGCSLYVSVDSILALATNAQGDTSVPFPIPNNTALAGLKLHNQFLVLDTGANSAGWVTTGGGSITISL